MRRSLFHVPGTPADARNAFVDGDSGTLPVSEVHGKSAGDRHHLWQVLILFKRRRRTSQMFHQRRDQQWNAQDLFVGIPLRRYPRVGVERTGDDHKPFGKRVLGAAHRALSVTVSSVSDTKKVCTRCHTESARTCAQNTARGQGERVRE